MSNVLISDGKTVTFSLEGSVEIPENEENFGAIDALASVLAQCQEVRDQLQLDPGKYSVRALLLVTEDDA